MYLEELNRIADHLLKTYTFALSSSNLNLKSLSIIAYTGVTHTTNADLSSKPVFIVILFYEYRLCQPIHFTFYKPKHVNLNLAR